MGRVRGSAVGLVALVATAMAITATAQAKQWRLLDHEINTHPEPRVALSGTLHRPKKFLYVINPTPSPQDSGAGVIHLSCSKRKAGGKVKQTEVPIAGPLTAGLAGLVVPRPMRAATCDLSLGASFVDSRAFPESQSPPASLEASLYGKRRLKPARR
jgi:hypothetical protein